MVFPLSFYSVPLAYVLNIQLVNNSPFLRGLKIARVSSFFVILFAAPSFPLASGSNTLTCNEVVYGFSAVCTFFYGTVECRTLRPAIEGQRPRPFWLSMTIVKPIPT